MSATTVPQGSIEAARPLALKAIGLVVVTTLLFWIAGAINGGAPTSVAVDGGGLTAAGGDGGDSGAAPAGDDGNEGSAQDDAAPSETPTADAEPSEDTSTDPEPEPTADPEPSEDATPEPEPEPEPTADPEPEASEEPADDGAIPASSVSIQVLDAVLDDGGATAEKVAARLRNAGYRVVVVNKASRVYEATTVFYSASSGKDAANQVARTFGFPDVNAKPDNLSDSVTLHLAVGRDQS